MRRVKLQTCLVLACFFADLTPQTAVADPADITASVPMNGLGDELALCMMSAPSRDSADACTRLIQSGAHTPDALAALYDRRAKIYLRLNLIEAAFADFVEAIRVSPRRAYSYIERGKAYFYRRDYVRASADFDRAGELDHRDPDTLNWRCWVRAVMGDDLETASRLCDRALFARPNRPAYLDSRGLIELKTQKFDSAWADYDLAFRWRPEAAHYLYGRGIAALRLGRTVEGHADIARATTMDADIDEQYSGYGVTP